MPNRKLLFSVTKKDLRIEYFSATGAGGQYRNKHQNCVRLNHPESGVIVTGQSHRERPANLREAMQNLANAPLFKIWMSQKTHTALTGKTIEQQVEEMMGPGNLKVEGKDSAGRWVAYSEMNAGDDEHC